MPLYDFQCAKCETVFEVERAFGATTKVKCPSCGSTRTTKVFNAAGIVFKGSGFYVTDSKAPPSASKVAPSAEPTPAAESKPAETPASDPKPAKKEKTS